MQRAVETAGLSCKATDGYPAEVSPLGDAFFIDLDGDQEQALRLVEKASADAGATVIACSSREDSQLVVKAMRAGAREFLAFPLDADELREALKRAASAREEAGESAKALTQVILFWGAKGGVGATTLAANFAIALREESGRPVALADLNFYLGDLANALGIEQKFTIGDAIASLDRLDGDFLDALMAQHASGVSVLAGPDTFGAGPAMANGEFKSLIRVLRQRFSYIVLDAGPASVHAMKSVFECAQRVFLVASGDIPTIRNAQRFIGQIHLMNGHGPKLDLVLNRVRSRDQIDDAQISRTLNTPVAWRIPNDYSRVQEALNRGVPLAETRSAVLSTLHAMARDVCGKPRAASSNPWSFLMGSKRG
jgi:pilus assembly protein CpaE